jgi:cell division protein FtsW (lipid II flippase)
VQVLQEPDVIKDYLKVICDQIRWKKAHNVISEELENHILDQKEAFVHSGLDEKTATENALAEMGDPVLIGTELDRAHRPKVDRSIILFIIVALIMNLVIRVIIIENTDIMLSTILKSMFYTAMGIGCMVLAYFLDFSFLVKYPKRIYFGVIVVMLLIVVRAPVAYAAPYINFIQMLLPTALAGIIYKMRTKGYVGIIMSGAFAYLGLLTGMISRNIVSTLLFLVICCILLTFAIIKGWFNVNKLIALLIVYIPMVVTIIITTFDGMYRGTRLRTIVNPFAESEAIGYVAATIRRMISGAVFFGTSELGVHYAKGLPLKETDYLLTYLIHRFGWISFILIGAVLSAFLIRAFILCSKQKSLLGKLVAVSVLMTLTMQFVLYIVSNFGLTALSPLALPLITHSGTATVVNMTLIGLMLSVFTSGDLYRDNFKFLNKRKFKLLQFVDGKIIINLK